MPSHDPIPTPIPAPMTAASRFSYRCTRCNSCCVDKRIQVNPYEIARLARNRGVSTAEARETFITADSALRQQEDGRCVFLGDQGCSVHADRPLVCRLFPLGRVIDAAGKVHFVPYPDPLAARGEFGEAGAVADYLEAQGATAFIAAADAYFAFFCRANARMGADTPIVADPDRDLLDIDSEIAAACTASGVAEPEDLLERMWLHISLLDEMLDR
ncbi:YkgJ family cysteine cluster protein [Sphingomonas pruni]|uniref:YkgJ family cysteine cluster protein n=1 Tax=Sphingomonas pruni TaxID=40683 RepID=UPI000AF20EBF|nr:YkgJ family cysteine cluster protein [Sphingomonas pruni]